jgi:hypothetical protein
LITTLVKELILMKGLSGTIVMLVIHTLLSWCWIWTIFKLMWTCTKPF